MYIARLPQRRTLRVVAMGRILIVCEDKPFRTSLAKTLAKEGYDVEAVEGLERESAGKRLAAFDLVIWDVGTAAGGEVRRLRQLGARCQRLLVISTVGDGAWDGQTGVWTEAQYLQRPVKRDVLLHKVRELMS